MNYFLLLRKADELGINFWLGGLALGLGAALFLQSFYYFSVINRDLPATVQSALAKSEEAERGKNAVTLASRVHATIAQTKRLYSQSIAVKNRDGVITLTGEVPTEIDRDLAGNVAKETPGVKVVNNEIQVVARLKPVGEGNTQGTSAINVEDLEMEANLREALQTVAEFKVLPIQIKVRHREVTLTGSVANEQQRQRAEQIIRNAPKVSLVNNQLRLGH